MNSDLPRSPGRLLPLLLLVLACALPQSARAQGLEVFPLFIDVQTDPGSPRSIQVTNAFRSPIAVSARVVERRIAPDGSESPPVPADGDFQVFPPQALVPPGGAQVVRVQWRGSRDLAQTRSYYLLIEQLPLTFGGQLRQQGGELSMLLNLLVHLYVSPPGSTAEVRIEDAERRGGDRLGFVARNGGNRYQLLRDGVLRVDCADTGAPLAEIDGDRLAEILPGTFVPPFGSRRYEISVPGAGRCRDPRVAFAPYD